MYIPLEEMSVSFFLVEHRTNLQHCELPLRSHNLGPEMASGLTFGMKNSLSMVKYGYRRVECFWQMDMNDQISSIHHLQSGIWFIHLDIFGMEDGRMFPVDYLDSNDLYGLRGLRSTWKQTFAVKRFCRLLVPPEIRWYNTNSVSNDKQQWSYMLRFHIGGFQWAKFDWSHFPELI